MILSTGPWSASMFAVLLLAAAAALSYLLAAWPGSHPQQDRALRVGCAVHGLVLLAHLLGVGIGGASARVGFAPVLSVTVWLVLIVYVVESHFVPLRGVRRALALAGLVTLPALLLFPGHGAGHAPSWWEPLHVILAIASYVLFGAAVLHGIALDRSDSAMRKGSAALQLDASAPLSGGAVALPLLALEKLTFRFVGAGFALLSAALVLGLWHASPWRWDHKSVLSLLGWAVFAALLMGRHMLGWRGRRATRWLYAGAVLLLLAYVGSRFVLEVVLHRPLGMALGAA